MAISRRVLRASKEVKAPRPAPISSTVLCDKSPKASAMRSAAEVSIRKCWPNFGVLGVGRAADTFGTLTLFLWDDYTELSASLRRRRGMQRCRPPMITCAEAAAIIWRMAFMHIAFAASECVPFSKTGGLADVVGALPRALAAAGHQVSVYVPRYRQTKLTDARTVVRSITVPFDDHYRFCSVVTAGSKSGVDHYFVEYPPFFDRDALYGSSSGDYPDNAERFALFSRAVLEA